MNSQLCPHYPIGLPIGIHAADVQPGGTQFKSVYQLGLAQIINEIPWCIAIRGAVQKRLEP